MFQLLFLFIRASRQGLWELHLSSLHEMSKYFFAHDQINYARLVPLYLADMYTLKENDQQTWECLSNGNFTVSKSDICFTSIGVDHALEQENKRLKVYGGIKGLTNVNNMSALNKFMLIEPEINDICNVVDKILSYINTLPRIKHHESSASKNKRVTKNVNKLQKFMNSFDINFENGQKLHNVITKAIIPDSYTNEIISNGEEGQKMYKNFVKERIEGQMSIWFPMKMRKLNFYVLYENCKN